MSPSFYCRARLVHRKLFILKYPLTPGRLTRPQSRIDHSGIARSEKPRSIEPFRFSWSALRAYQRLWHWPFRVERATRAAPAPAERKTEEKRRKITKLQSRIIIAQVRRAHMQQACSVRYTIALCVLCCSAAHVIRAFSIAFMLPCMQLRSISAWLSATRGVPVFCFEFFFSLWILVHFAFCRFSAMPRSSRSVLWGPLHQLYGVLNALSVPSNCYFC